MRSSMRFRDSVEQSMMCSAVAITLLSLVVMSAALTTHAAPVKRPNVLFIVADDMNNHLGCYGHDVKTPSIDELARRGMRFDRAYCQVPVCNPSRVSFLSGLRPDKTQVFTLVTHTRAHLGDWVMLPEYFRKSGYFTAQIGKIYHTDDGFEDPRSWNIEIREFGKRPSEDDVIKAGEPGGAGQHTIDWASLSTPDEKTPDGIVARRAVQIMKEAEGRNQPYFLGIGFRRPHAPYAAPRKYFDLYPPESIKLPEKGPSGHFAILLPAAINHPPRSRDLTEREQRELIAAYYACTSFVDAQVQVVLDAVSELDAWDNTIVVFIGDHGYHLGEHGGLWHKMSLFEESVRVPLIVYAPGMKAAGKSCDRLVELIDLYPTLVSLCGIPSREGLDGIELSPSLDDPTKPTKDAAYTMSTRDDSPAKDHSKVMSYQGRSIRTDRWRYTEWDGSKRGVELYDHDNDPHEWKNLAEEPQYEDTMRELHEALLAEGQVATGNASGQ
jgi:iduronate 2-sulfatase